MIITSKISLDRSFNLFKSNLKKYPKIWKPGVYSKIVKNYKALEQGLLIEDYLREVLHAKDLDTDEKSASVTGTNGDFRLNDDINIDINAKSIIQQKGVVLISNGEMGSKQIKVFDLSRKSTHQTLEEKLEEINYEEIFMVYTFDKKLLKGYVFLTSLTEISSYKLKLNGINNPNEDDLKEEIRKLFKFNGGSHYTINAKDVYNSSKFNNRIMSYSVNEKTVEEYVQRKKEIEKHVFERVN